MAISLNSASALVSEFFTWWLGELEAMWQPLRRLAWQAPKLLTVDTSDQQWVLRLQRGSRIHELGGIDSRSQVSVGRKTLRALIKKAKLDHADITVLIPASRSLRRPLDMPNIAATDLRQALFFEIERQTPFQPEDVYFDYLVFAGRSESKRLAVELITAPRSTVDPILRQLNEWGFESSTVDVAASNARNGIGINLLKADRSTTRWSSLRVASVLLCIVLLAAVFYVPVSQLGAEDESLAAQVAQESGKAKQILSKRAELEEAVRAAAFLDERKKLAPGVLTILNELTKALPDDTWLINLSQNQAGVKISGYSAAAAELISLIDAAPLFKNPTFSSPIVQDPQKKRERFDISFEVESRGGKQ